MMQDNNVFGGCIEGGGNFCRHLECIDLVNYRKEDGEEGYNAQVWSYCEKKNKITKGYYEGESEVEGAGNVMQFMQMKMLHRMHNEKKMEERRKEEEKG